MWIAKTKIIHTIKASVASVADALALPHLLHGKETRGWGDQAYRGQREVTAALANLFIVRRQLLHA